MVVPLCRLLTTGPSIRTNKLKLPTPAPIPPLHSVKLELPRHHAGELLDQRSQASVEVDKESSVTQVATRLVASLRDITQHPTPLCASAVTELTVHTNCCCPSWCARRLYESDQANKVALTAKSEAIANVPLAQQTSPHPLFCSLTVAHTHCFSYRLG